MAEEETEDKQTSDDEESKKPKVRRKASLKEKILWVILVVGIIFVLRQAAVILLIATLPALVVKFTDETENQIWFRTIGCFNLAGIYPYLIEITMMPMMTTSAVQDLMTNSIMWFTAYGAAAVGYAAMWFFPNVSEFLLRVFNTKRIERHRNSLRRLHKEWNVGDPMLFDD